MHQRLLCQSIYVGNGPRNNAQQSAGTDLSAGETVRHPAAAVTVTGLRQWTGGPSSASCPPGPSLEQGSSILALLTLRAR